MGVIEVGNNRINILACIILYGNAANEKLAHLLACEIETMWNEPQATLLLEGSVKQIIFTITYRYAPLLTPLEVISNLNAANNYFRVEEYARGNISFVDGIGSNTGYFLLSNLQEGSTTAAHEFGHTIGLKHPEDTNYNGKGIPGIMYPRGTLVDANYQYNPAAGTGDHQNGGTMNPIFRKVKQEDINLLNIAQKCAAIPRVLGAFTSVWHDAH